MPILHCMREKDSRYSGSYSVSRYDKFALWLIVVLLIGISFGIGRIAEALAH